jgi:hypothetical protein
MGPSARDEPQQHVDSYEEGEQAQFLKIEQGVEGKYFGCTGGKYHVDYEAIDVETVEIVDLHVEEYQY